MNVAVSPMAREAASPMITSVTPSFEEEEAGPSLSQGGLCREGLAQERDPAWRYQNQKPPPLHTGADWKVVLHLPEIETWLRATTDRVRDLSHSVHQDSVNKHLDVHLVQLKDICEDISDHVEQIHALLETEFSLKLLSYSVNIIVDIRSVQLLWHQLRVSVLVLKERLLQGLQDSNGNYTRQTDILQAFSQDHHQARLDALTEVDDCGQVTIKCSQDYLSLDCGITAYELSDYSPSEDQEGTSGLGQGQEPGCRYTSLKSDFPELIQSVDLLTITAKQSQNQGAVSEQEEEEPGTPIEKHRDKPSSAGEENNPAPGPKMHCDTPQSESTPLSKQPLQGSVSNEVSPTQPVLPKKTIYLEGEAESSLSLRRSTLPPSLQFQADLSQSTPSLLDLPDRCKFWLELNAVCPSNASQSFDSLQVMNSMNLQASRQREAGGYQRQGSPVGTHIPLQRSSSEVDQGGHFPQDLSSIPILFSGNNGCSRVLKDPQTDRDTDSSLPSPMREPSDHESHDEATSEDFRPPTKEAVWIIQPQCPHLHHPAPVGTSPNPSKEHWFRSDEFLALPAKLKKTEMLAMKLETLAQRPGHQGHHESIQDVDDWELTEVNSDWEGEGPGSPQPPLGFDVLQPPYKRPFHVGMGHFSPTLSSDMTPSLDESIDSAPLRDLLSEDEAWSSRESRKRDNDRGWSSGETRVRDTNRSLALHPTTTTTMAPHIETQCKPFIQQLLDDIQHHDNHPDIWDKMESLCLEVCGRRKGVSSLLRLSQRLQEEQEQQSGPDSEQQALQLQLLTVNLERRWEAIVMQVLQWQTRLRRALGTDQVPGNIVEAGLMDLHGPAEDSWEWDEMDMAIVEYMEPQEFDNKQNAECESGPGSPGTGLDYDMSESSPRVTQRGMSLNESSRMTPLSSHCPSVYQVYSLHNVQLYRQPHYPSVHKTSSPVKAGRKQPLLKILSKDSSFSSVESLPDLLGGLFGGGKQGGRGGGSARRSESESGTVSEGEKESTANSVVCLDDPWRGGSTYLRPPPGVNSPGEDDDEGDRLCDEDIDRILERANKVALYGDCVSVTALRDQDHNRCKAEKKKRGGGGGEEGGGGGENRRRHGRKSNVEILISPDSEEDERRVTGVKGRRDREIPHLSQGSSLESLYAVGELFPSGKDTLQRSTSLESWLAPCKSWEEAEGEGGSQGSLRELGLGTTGELSRRTLELLKRLENIQTPLHDLKMTRSISDITLQSSSSLCHPGVGYGSWGPGHAGCLLGGRGGSPSSVNESSAASLTELSSTEDSSVGSEDLAVLRNRCYLLDSNASFRKHHHRAQPGGHHGGHGGHDEADASISMVVNVSCTSACTDDEDDSDFLSSSTLTLTEEELGIKEDEEEDSDLLSSSTLTLTEEELGIKEDEEEDRSVASEEENMEGSLGLGMEYMKNEFHNWIHNPSRSQQQSQSGRDKNLGDELQCDTLSKDRTNRLSVGNEHCSFLNRSSLRLLESHTNSNVKKECLGTLPDVVNTNRKNATRRYISQFVDDMENGNVENSHIKGKDEDDELLREEGSLFTKKGESFKNCYVNESVVIGGDQLRGMGMATATKPSSCETLSQLQAKESSLESQLRGEIPCQSSSHSSPSLSPLEDRGGSHHALQNPPCSGNSSQENLLSSFLCDVHTQQSIGDAKPIPDPNSDHPCCSHPHPQAPPRQDQKSQENVHNFVMEIINMASVALKNKESQAEDKERPGQTGAQIRDKVLEHSHRTIHLHKGDFYSYLSISSHDSDCGEVSACIDSKSTTPLLSPTPDIRDEEMLFEACPEKVYLGPPLRYSMAVTKRQRRHSPKLIDYYSSSLSPAAQSQSPSQAPLPTCNEYQEEHGISPGSIAGRQLQCHNGASYLNPLPCETLIDTVECLADTEMLESNISPVMTKIRVSCSSTNPLKEEGSLCPPIRKCDSDEKGSTSQWMKQKNVRKGYSSLQEVKSTHKQKQSPRSVQGCGEVRGLRPWGSGPVSDNSSASKTGTAMPQVRRLSGSVASATSKAQL
nr:A-kinase anchor protein 6-like [Oncorhynchus nerka]